VVIYTLVDLCKPAALSRFVTLVRNEIIANTRDVRFDEAKVAEMQQLLKREVSKWVQGSEVPVDANILRTKWVLVVKNAESDNPVYKARLVIQGHQDP
jgi:hypothetical protein